MNPASNFTVLTQSRALEDSASNNLARMISRIEDQKLVLLCAIFVDQGRLGLSEADEIIRSRLGDSAPKLSECVAEYRAPWWAPWRRGSARWAIRVPS